jgi:hypothetical protein
MMASRKRSTEPTRGRPPTGRAMTAADRMRRMRERRKADGLKPVVSWVPHAAPVRPGYSSHRLLEARSLAMHAVIAQKIERDPKLLSVPRNNLKRWSARWEKETPAWYRRWCEIVARPWPEIAAIITELSEEGARLRQSSPFAGVLSAAERKRIYEAFRA